MNEDREDPRKEGALPRWADTGSTELIISINQSDNPGISSHLDLPLYTLADRHACDEERTLQNIQQRQ